MKRTLVDKFTGERLIGAMRHLLAALALIAASPAAAMVGATSTALPGGRHEVMIVGSGGTFCTGAAIARDLVLTAGHCIASGTDYKIVEFDAAHTPKLLDVRQVARHPGFNMQTLLGHRATADVALLKMAAPLPSDIIPAALDRADRKPEPGDRYTVTGYGLAVRGDGKTGGTLRAAALIATGKPGNLQIRLVDAATNGASAGMGACTGDSGAPVYDGSALIGVVSWSTGPNMEAGCGGLTGVTPIALYRGWIVETARKFGSALGPQPE